MRVNAKLLYVKPPPGMTQSASQAGLRVTSTRPQRKALAEQGVHKRLCVHISTSTWCDAKHLPGRVSLHHRSTSAHNAGRAGCAHDMCRPPPGMVQGTSQAGPRKTTTRPRRDRRQSRVCEACMCRRCFVPLERGFSLCAAMLSTAHPEGGCHPVLRNSQASATHGTSCG